jgi:hypothetical protein
LWYSYISASETVGRGRGGRSRREWAGKEGEWERIRKGCEDYRGEEIKRGKRSWTNLKVSEERINKEVNDDERRKQ